MQDKELKKRGRPPKQAPEPIPDTPENIVQVVVKTRKRDSQQQEMKVE